MLLVLGVQWIELGLQAVIKKKIKEGKPLTRNEQRQKNLADIEWLQLPSEPEKANHGWQSFVTYCDPEKAPVPRNKLMEKLLEKGISTRPGTHAVHMLKLYKEKFVLHHDEFPNSRDCSNYSMAIPLHNKMTKEDYDYIIGTLHDF